MVFALLISSVVLLVFIVLYQWLQSRIGKVGTVVGLAACAVIAGFAHRYYAIDGGILSSSGGGVESKGATYEPWLLVGLMYGAMITGIIAQSYYFGIQAVPSTTWIKPILASPIIFIPLLSSYKPILGTTIDTITIDHLMILLVSFQNGFFWKVVFDKQAEAIQNQKAAGGPLSSIGK